MSITWTLTLALGLGIAGVLLTAPRSYAGGDSVLLQITNSPPFVFGSYPIDMSATVQLSSPVSRTPSEMSLRLSNGVSEWLTLLSTSPDRLTLTYHGSVSLVTGTVIPGDYTATASFANPDTGITTASNTVSFTVNKVHSSVTCRVIEGTVVAGSVFYLETTLNGISTPSGDTFKVSFAGPVSVPSVTLQTDLNGTIHTTAPAHTGKYTLTCAFAGDSRYQPATATTTLSVQGNAQVASIHLYANPTTVTRGVAMEFYIVLQPAAGQPAPTGYLTIFLGVIEYTGIKVGSNGATLVDLSPLPASGNPFSQIKVTYSGDSRYLTKTASFPLTNSAIPGSGGGSSATPTPKATSAAATWTATASTSGTPIATSTAGTGGNRRTGGTSLTAGSASGNTVLWLAGGLGLLFVLGASARRSLWRRMRAPQAAAGAEQERVPTLEP